MIYAAAVFLVMVGLPFMAICHTVVAERMDEYECSKRGESVEHRLSVSSAQARSTSMSSSRPTVSLFNSTENRLHAHSQRHTHDEGHSEVSSDQQVLSSVDLAAFQEPVRTTEEDHLGQGDLQELVRKDSIVPEREHTWSNKFTSYFLRGCSAVRFVVMEDIVE
jgi:hypothetical protein